MLRIALLLGLLPLLGCEDATKELAPYNVSVTTLDVEGNPLTCLRADYVIDTKEQPFKKYEFEFNIHNSTYDTGILETQVHYDIIDFDSCHIPYPSINQPATTLPTNWGDFDSDLIRREYRSAVYLAGETRYTLSLYIGADEYKVLRIRKDKEVIKKRIEKLNKQFNTKYYKQMREEILLGKLRAELK